MKAQFANQEQSLWPGQFVDVVVRLASEPGAIVVPESAVQAGQEGPYAFVIGKDARASIRRLEVERTIGGEVVVTKGLAPGEQVVIDGQVRLRQGSAVQIKAAPATSLHGEAAR